MASSEPPTNENQPLLQPDTVVEQQPPMQAKRVVYIDNVRVFLTILVVFHHAAIVYGGVGGWYYREPGKCSTPTNPILIFFQGLNQSFFMATFFVISGHFSLMSLMRKRSPWVFMKDKLWRLGIPTVLFVLFGKVIIQMFIEPAARRAPIHTLLNYWRSLRGVQGPVWFVAVLLCFDATLAVVVYLYGIDFFKPQMKKFNTQDEATAAGWTKSRFYTVAFLSLSLDILASFIIRLWYPIGTLFVPLGLLLGYLPQYILAYIVGIYFSILYPYLVSENSKNASSSLLLRYMFAIISIVAATALFGQNTVGGFNMAAFSYAVWNEVCFYLLGTGWLSLYACGAVESASGWQRRTLNPSNFLPARYTYGAFLLHPIPVSAIPFWLDSFDGWRDGAIPCFIKAFIVGILGTVGSWGLAWAAVQIPGVKSMI